jgi:putative ABC transport system permease protein
MSRLTSFWRNLFRRGRVERDLDDELRAMVELVVEENVRAGMTGEEARRLARLELGSVDTIKAHVRDARAGALVDSLARDFGHAARTLVKRPGVPLIIVITFALGSAGVTTIFALVNAILIRPLPYAASERLAAVKHAAPGLGLADAGLSSGTYFHYRAHAKSFEALAVYSENVLNVSVPGVATERVQVTHAGPEFFDVLGVRPALGRLFTNEDARPGFMNTTWPVPVLLSHQYWERRYGGDPNVIGGTITLNNRARHVIGVLPATFSFPRPETEIWMLFVPPERTASFARQLEYGAIARLRPGVSADAAAAELERILPSIEGVYADATAERLAEVQLKPSVVPLKEQVIGDVRTLLLLLFGGTTFLLLVAYANTATLSLVRAEYREREMAVRFALGARPTDLIRLFLSEAALLSTAGAALGLLLAHLALKGIVVFTPVRLPRLSEVELDGWVFAFTLSLAAVGALVFGGLAFLRQSVPAAAALKASTRFTDDGGRLRMRNMLVAVQVALALTLSVGSALMVQSFWRLTRVDPGFDPSGVLTVEIGLPGSSAGRHQQIYKELLDRVRALPSVQRASAASSLPLDGIAYAYPVAIGAAVKSTELPIAMKFVMPEYFQTMRIPVINGASFTTDESFSLPNTVFVSAAFARRYFRGESPIGKNIRRLEADGTEVQMFDRAAKAPPPAPVWTIGGVVADVREESLRVEPVEMVYIPVRDPAVERSIVPTNMSVVIRSDGPTTSLAGAVRQTIREVDTALSVARIRPMDAILTSSVATERFLATLLLVAAGVSLFLGAIGVYGVAAQAVRRREQELGIRVTLGARPGQLVEMVLRESLAFVLMGAVVGLTIALAATRALRAFLYEMSATDPATLAAVTALVIAVALVACLVPARRAMRLDPIAALRGS